MRSFVISAVLAGACTLAAFGCDDDRGPTIIDPVDEPGLSFQYSGDRSGSYRSEGVPTIGAGGLPEVGSWAVARRDSLGGLVIAGFEPTTGTMGDLFLLQLTPIRTGTFAPCREQGDAGCHGRIFFGVDTEDLSSVGAWFEITSGSITLTEVSEVVRGTFSVGLTRRDSTETIAIEDGTIFVPFSDDPDLSNGLACLARNLQAGTNEPC